MTVDDKNACRLGIYFFYDAQGIADEYVFYFLNHIRPSLEKLYIVCNGHIQEKFLERFKQEASAEVLVRDNSGSDATAYQATMDHIGFERLADYDEMILMNHTVFGPLTPFDEMFAAMSSRDLDFWGITSHAGVTENNGSANIPEYIQSHFLVIRRSILASPAYQIYWEGLPPFKSRENSISHFERTFTQHFSSLGFRWETYTGTERLAHISPNPIITIPYCVIQTGTPHESSWTISKTIRITPSI